MAPRIDISPAEVRSMGDKAQHVADDPLTKAGKTMSDGYDGQSAAKLTGFQTKDTLDTLLADWVANTSVDTTTIRSVGDKLHGTANAIIRGDNHSTDEFKPVPDVYVPHHGYMEMR